AVGVAVLAVAVPGDDAVAGRADAHDRPELVAGGEGVDPELAAQRPARGAVAPRVGAGAGAVLAVTLPGDDEVAGRAHPHRWEHLVGGGVGVDRELAALG